MYGGLLRCRTLLELKLLPFAANRVHALFEGIKLSSVPLHLITLFGSQTLTRQGQSWMMSDLEGCNVWSRNSLRNGGVDPPVPEARDCPLRAQCGRSTT
jgi:hypothetical protein